MSKRARQRAKRKKTLKRATRRSLLGLAIGCGLGIGLFMIVVSVTPTISSKQLADAVRSQTLRAATMPTSQLSNPPASYGLPNFNTSPTNKDGSAPIGFEQLAGFPFAITHQMLAPSQDPTAASASTLEQIPTAIKVLNDRSVSVKGFMLPMKFNGALTTDFLLMRNQNLCCYGMPPKITEWVNVHMPGNGVKPMMDQPVTICGTFHVREVRENGDLVGIYELVGQKLTRE